MDSARSSPISPADVAMASKPATRRLARWRRRRHGGPPGTAPGTLRPHPDAPKSRITATVYTPDSISEFEITGAGDIAGLRDQPGVAWINVDGLGDTEIIAELGRVFGVHRLALEDVVNVHQRPKVEAYDDHLFIVARMPTGERGAESEQVSFHLGKAYVLTFQERPGDCLDPIRERLRHGRGRVRTCGADYLVYALLDAIIDAYFPILENYGERLDDLEDTVMSSPQDTTLGTIHQLKGDLLGIRRSVWPMRDMVNNLIRDTSPLITEQTRIYLRDCYDHLAQLMDLTETFREITADLLDVYHSSISMRLNEIMKVLTVIATIFMPLSFITGLYGMNFDTAASSWNMPELNWPFGYLFALGLMVATAAGLLVYFHRRGWIGRATRRRR